MTIASVSRTSTSTSKYGLPPTLRTAQAAMQLPEVQDMLRRLSAFQLGIFMPHQHDEATGEFLPLPFDVMQVESGLAVMVSTGLGAAAKTPAQRPDPQPTQKDAV